MVPELSFDAAAALRTGRCVQNVQTVTPGCAGGSRSPEIPIVPAVQEVGTNATPLVFEAKKRFGLCVLDYTVTSNDDHLLV